MTDLFNTDEVKHLISSLDPEQDKENDGDHNVTEDIQVPISLRRIVEAFGIGINEEQAWAILHQTARSIGGIRKRKNKNKSDNTTLLDNAMDASSTFVEAEDDDGKNQNHNHKQQTGFACWLDIDSLLLHGNGSISVKWPESISVNTDYEDFQAGNILQKLAFTVFEACSYGLAAQEEPVLSQEIANLLEQMGNGECRHQEEEMERSGSSRNSNPVDWIEPGSEEDEVSSERSLKSSVEPVDNVIKCCKQHLKDPSIDASAHYEAVCRALVVECSDLVEFLKRVKSKTSNINEGCPADRFRQSEIIAVPPEEEFRDWAKLWLQVIGKLREGVKLRKVESSLCNRVPDIYELTPYEMLMEDIRMRRYLLRNAPAPETGPRRIDAHDVILEYIRSRPPLMPAENRILRPRMEHLTPVEVLMESIRHFQFGSLRKTKDKSLKSSSGTSPKERCVIQPSSSFEMDKSVAAEPVLTPVQTPRRRLIMPDENTPPPVDFLSAINEDSDLNLGQNGVEDVDDSDIEDDFHTTSPRYTYSPHDNELSFIGGAGRNQSDVVSLTLDEIALIRGALAKAELENLEEQDLALYNDVRRSKVCYSCKRAKLNYGWFFRTVATKCHLCQNTICISCAREMILPCDRLDRIPVHTLSPTIASEDEPFPQAQNQTPNILNKRPLFSSSTMPRSREPARFTMTRSQTQDLSFSTLPKPANRARPPLQRGTTVIGTEPANDTHNSSSITDRNRNNPFNKASAENEGIIVQVCLECHSVLYHAIRESQTHLSAIYSRPKTTGNGGGTTRNDAGFFGKSRLASSMTSNDLNTGRTSSASLYHTFQPKTFATSQRSASHYFLPSDNFSRPTSKQNGSTGVYTSSSSVVSDSQSDSLDEELNADEIEDFLEGPSQPVGVGEIHMNRTSSPALSMSRSDSMASADGTTTGRPAGFFTNHI